MDPCLDCVALATSFTLWHYASAALAGSLAIRFVTTLLRAWRANVEDDAPFWKAFGRIYLGIGARQFQASLDNEDREKHRGDYLAAAILAFLELLAYPVLIKAMLYTYVGAWVALKVIARYESWKSDRGSVTRFLIGNAAVLILSFMIAQVLLVDTSDVYTDT